MYRLSNGNFDLRGLSAALGLSASLLRRENAEDVIELDGAACNALARLLGAAAVALEQAHIDEQTCGEA